MGTIKAICISEKRGTVKQEVQNAVLCENWGIKGDAHGGTWHRQVSLLSHEKIEEFKERGAEVKAGSFGENLVIEGIDLKQCPVGSRLYCNDIILEITQIGKSCHSHCEIYKMVGDCIMPREGIFARVIRGGTLSVGDTISWEPAKKDLPYTAAVITLSDKGAAGEREDRSGPLIVERLEKKGFRIIETMILPDTQAMIERELKRLADQRQVQLILTTGGTGFSARDCTPEATLAVATRNAPGIAEAIRAESLKITKRAMLSREASVIRNQTLIINLPGSPKAVGECLDVIEDQLEHGIGILIGRDRECGGKRAE